MQFLEMAKDMTLSALSAIVGERNVDTVLNANNLGRTVNIGQAFADKIADIKKESTGVDYQKKLSILNQFVGDSDLYEKAALGTEDNWRALATANCFTDAIRIPQEIQLPSSVGVLGNSEPISDSIYNACVAGLTSGEHAIDPTIFSEYNATFSGSSVGITQGSNTRSEALQWFNLPWGEITMYSSIDGSTLEFPVYPEEFDDGVSANYEEMNEMLYQYEPWKVYKSSGPRELTLDFEFHRDMWTGDHRDGCANDLIRGCEANCYPQYNGSLVNVPIVTIYIHGTRLITGVMTSCKPHWSGPIGLDGFYLMCKLSITITEVSPEALNFDTVRSKGLIG